MTNFLVKMNCLTVYRENFFNILPYQLELEKEENAEETLCAYCFDQNPGVRGEHLGIRPLWATARLSITCVSFIYIVDEFLFLSLVWLNEMRMVDGWI